MKLRLPALLLVPLLAAGCLGGDGDAPSATTEDDGVARASTLDAQVEQFSGTLTVGVGVAGVGYLLPSDLFEVDVGANATGLVIELTWTDAREDLDLAIFAPDGTRANHADGTVGAGDSPLKVVLPAADIQEGTYAFRVLGKAAAQEDFQLYVSIFQGQAPTDDYTAVSADAAP